MRLFVSAASAALVLLSPSAASAKTPAFDPREWKGAQAGLPTQVLTLGSTHLSQLDNAVTPEMLAPLLDKLAAFKPDVITHEGISGEQCDTLKRYPARYPDMFDTYCWPTDDAEKATGLTIPAALAEIDKTFLTWPARPSSAQRRHLAAVFIAGGDRPSAYVQWLQLPLADRKIGDGIDAALLKILTRSPKKLNETYDVAVVLAARLGHQRVYAVDDHTADHVQAEAGPGFDPYMQKFWTGAKSPLLDEDRRMSAAMKSGVDLLAYYRFINQPAAQREYITIDHRRAMTTPSPEQYGRAYFAWWEVRNLRMVSNIRAAFGNHPGTRVLNVVGSSHKPYYDAYLDMMSDVKLVDAETVLK
ncbi:DUF5694 domain-containing protein [Novosphingobium sp.]|uniref:DUF5694 domain-containing protein n=1 Tax=Novosphingobium sp. TaxID=1874826 RepID=UPI0025F61EBB|nr:DUF5694 domain-containing protein [Novosphingobium sp.]